MSSHGRRRRGSLIRDWNSLDKKLEADASGGEGKRTGGGATSALTPIFLLYSFSGRRGNQTCFVVEGREGLLLHTVVCFLFPNSLFLSPDLFLSSSSVSESRVNQ